MRNRISLLFCALLLALAGCQKQHQESIPEERRTPHYNDAGYLLDGLFRQVDGEYLPIQGFLRENELVIPVTSVFEAERHFRSLLPSYASPLEDGVRLIWSMTDDQDKAQGDVVFSLGGDASSLARIILPDSFPQGIRLVTYRSSEGLVQAVDPAVREDLEDNYYYGAIVEIANHGHGSGKFVVFREYNFSNNAPGMAVRLDGHHWEHWELILKDNSRRVFERASCLNTMKQAGEIYRKDKDILSKQLRNAGCTILDQHYASSTSTWNGWNYYYCLHSGESDWIGPIHDTDFYECWIYWFEPQGGGIRFW